MKKSAVASIIGILLMLLAGAQLIPLAVAYAYESADEISVFLWSVGISFGTGLALYFTFRFGRQRTSLGIREAFAVVALGWGVLSAFGAIPFYLIKSPEIPTFLDAYFEAMSGFTTTGASIVPHPEALPRGVLFWRSFTHWFGGMGIVVLTVAILPFLGAGGYQLLRAEVPGPTADKLRPRIAETAKVLWLVYVALTGVEIVALLPAMGLYDAACHAFGTLATGGFSTKNASIDSFGSVYIDVVLTLFMIAAGVNFVLHIQVLQGRGFRYLLDSEFRFFIGLIVMGTVIISGFLWFDTFSDKVEHPEKYSNPANCIRYASFQVASIVTTTGYGTADFDGWPNSCRFLLLILMFVGGCAGSTGGGVKCVRVLLLLKYGVREILQIIRPRAILHVKIGGKAVDRELVGRVMGFLALWFTVFVLAVLVMTIVLHPAVPEGSAKEFQGIHGEYDLHDRRAAESRKAFETSLGAVLATIGNIGPGIAEVGPTRNFADIPPVGKAILIFCMLLGRLEIYSVLILFVPLTWKP